MQVRMGFSSHQDRSIRTASSSEAPGCSPPRTRRSGSPLARLPALMQHCVGAAGSYGNGGLSQLALRPLSPAFLHISLICAA